MTEPITIARLTPEDVAALSPRLAALDAEIVDEFGADYSHVKWSAVEFQRELPGKWTHSVVALSDHQPHGFWIAYERGASVHTSRVAIAASARRGGVGRRLFEMVRTTACGSGASRMTLTIAHGNEMARRFYAALGFVRLRGDDLEAFVRDAGRAGYVSDDEICEENSRGVFRYQAFAYFC